MSSSASESLLTESDHVSIEKEYQPNEYEVPTVHFRLSADEDARTVQRIVLRDRVPDSLRLQDVGIYSSGEYLGHKWEIKSTDEIRFPIQLRPGETAETLIAFQAGENELSVDNVLSEPIVLYEDDLEESFEEIIDGELIEVAEDDDKEEDGPVESEIDGATDDEEDGMGGHGDSGDDEVATDVTEDDTDPLDSESQSDDADTVEDSSGEDSKQGDEEENSSERAEESSGDSRHNNQDVTEENSPAEDDDTTVTAGSAEDDEMSTGMEGSASSDSEGVPDQVSTDETESAVAVAEPEDVIENGSGTGAANGGNVIAVEEESVTRRVVDELEDDSVSEQLRNRLRSQLLNDTSAGGQASKSLEARVEHLQSDITELLAYRDSLKEFIDSQSARGDRLEALEDEVSELEIAVDQLHEEIDARDNVREDEIQSVKSAVEEVEMALSEVEADIDEVREIRDRLVEAFDSS